MPQEFIYSFDQDSGLGAADAALGRALIAKLPAQFQLLANRPACAVMISKEKAETMDIQAARKMTNEHRERVEQVLNRYVSTHGCPCNWRQFAYWAGKRQGPGWHDSTQNYLVAATVTLPCFRSATPTPAPYSDNTIVRCTNCGAEWLHTIEEWRMLAFWERLIPMPWKPENERDNYPDFDFIGPGVFATAGREPNEKKMFSLDDWAEFMLGELYSPELETEQLEANTMHTPVPPASLLRRLFAYFK